MTKQILVIANPKLISKFTHIKHINIKHFAKLEGCKEKDIQRLIYGL